MQLNEYQEKAQEFSQYPGKDYGELGFAALGLANQVGKAAKMAQKHDIEREISPDEYKKALGGALWFIAELAHQAGVTLEQVAQANLRYLASKEFKPLD